VRIKLDLEMRAYFFLLFYVIPNPQSDNLSARAASPSAAPLFLLASGVGAGAPAHSNARHTRTGSN
jgi:hypothetical protein